MVAARQALAEARAKAATSRVGSACHTAFVVGRVSSQHAVRRAPSVSEALDCALLLVAQQRIVPCSVPLAWSASGVGGGSEGNDGSERFHG